MLENDRHLAIDVLLGEGTEAARGVGGEGEVDLPLAGILRGAIFGGAAEVAAGDDGRAAQNVPDFTLIGSRARRFVAACGDFAGWRKHAGVRGERRRTYQTSP